MSTVVFDIETDQFNDAFRNAKDEDVKLKNAPQMRIACIFKVEEQIYEYYTQDQSKELIAELKKASTVISFNGIDFDVLVLRANYKLRGKIPTKGEHVDLHKIMSKEAGFRVSLDKASKMNLGENKNTKGREMASLNLEELKIACQSDVYQTYRLWLLYKNNNLFVPIKRPKDSPDKFHLGPGHHMPDICPVCHDVGSLDFIEFDTDEMTEGQWSDYIAGMYGEAYCSTCNNVIEWEV